MNRPGSPSSADATPVVGGERFPCGVAQMSDLASRIRELQAEFQRFADIHPWICFGRRTHEGEFAEPTAAEADGEMPYFVRSLSSRSARAVLDSVNDLTCRALKLLLEVLREPNTIPPDKAQWISDFQPTEILQPWVRWLS